MILVKKEYEILIGELIGLARATDGNEHLINASATAMIRECLLAVNDDSVDVDFFISRIREEKRRMVPNCFSCANPCGRTSPFDLSELPEGAIRELKLSLLNMLCHNTESVSEEKLYRNLVVIGISDYEEQDLIPLLQELS